MAEITPTPEAGSWVKADPFTGPWTPQPEAGSWTRIDPYQFRRRAHRHIGLVRGARGVG